MAVERRKEPEVQIEHLVGIAVKETLTTIGFDMTTPTAIQKDIQHLRRSREICELIQNKAIAMVIAAIITATVGAAWTGFVMAVERQEVKAESR